MKNITNKIKLKFTDIWNPPYPEEHLKSGGGTLCGKLNGISAQIFMSASYNGTELPAPKISEKWIDYVGGFIDEYFFNKEAIEKLPKNELITLLNYIKKQKCANCSNEENRI